MTHQQILDKLHKRMAEAIDNDLHRLIPHLMIGKKELETKEVLNNLMPRWDCALNAPEKETTKSYKDMIILSIAVLLHKYGLKDNNITEKAIKAIDSLNEGVVTSDAFFRQSKEIKDFIQTVPKPLIKRPSHIASTTFYRAKDVISIQLEGKYCAAYIHDNQHHEVPIIEFYDIVFDHKPTIEELIGIKAKGAKYNDGTQRVSKQAVYGLKDLPDYANQVHLIKASVEEIPDNSHLKESIGLYGVSNLFEIQRVLKAIIANL